ncbi:hypothetical protein D0Z07_5645 [Hyphodiscus hymeniophilus]|uniref:Uncharacterized protein n=1 Tax=Hyphodiscus hymeniophilus TaxID=353542 RepID=A0A9P6VH31_9HELO|nr:hypothetical protein D0Z07_5645 [Hyphodiscus hymeniophilus]
MPLRDILRKKEKVSESDAPVPGAARDLQEEERQTGPVFTFMRSDTHTQEIISPPTFSSAESFEPPSFADGSAEKHTSRFFKGRGRSSSQVSATSTTSRASQGSKTRSPKSKRLSERLHLRRNENSSSSVPTDLPDIAVEDEPAGAESQWERRATMLAKKNEQERSRPSTPMGSTTDLNAFQDLAIAGGGTPGKEKGPISTKHADDDIQEAIRLHEAGDLENSTRMFGRLADPNGENNALSQVLYGLALRHGWGCVPDPTEAVTYLSAAASNAASIEELALKAGMKKGGAAKGELVLAIFELANCFRHGWGTPVDKCAAQKVGHSKGLDRGEAYAFADIGGNAMNEVAWCYLEGFGVKKNKVCTQQRNTTG